MATTYKVIQDVRMGQLSEYYGSFSASVTSDTLLMSFEGELMLTDLIVSQGSTDVTFNVSLLYPSSGISAKLNSSVLTSTEWSLNGNAGQNGNKWYRLPSGGAIEIQVVTVNSSGPVEVVVVGK